MTTSSQARMLPSPNPISSLGSGAYVSPVNSLGPMVANSSQLLRQELSGAPTTAPFPPSMSNGNASVSVRNTFIQVESQEKTLHRRSRRSVTLPPSNHPDGPDVNIEEQDDAMLAATAPLAAFREGFVAAQQSTRVPRRVNLGSLYNQPQSVFRPLDVLARTPIEPPSNFSGYRAAPVAMTGSSPATSVGQSLFQTTPCTSSGPTSFPSSTPVSSIGLNLFPPTPATSLGPNLFPPTPVTSVGQNLFPPTPVTSVGQNLFPPTPVTSLGPNTVPQLPSNNGPTNFTYTSLPSAWTNPQVEDARYNPLVVKNTFISVDNSEDLHPNRREIHRKTEPNSAALIGDVDESVPTRSLPVAQMARVLVNGSQNGSQWQWQAPQMATSPTNQTPSVMMVPQQRTSLQIPAPGATHAPYAMVQMSPMAMGSQSVFMMPMGAVSPTSTNPPVSAQGSGQGFAQNVTNSVDGRSLLGSIWRLSQDAQGCRQVQDVLDRSSDDIRLAIAAELQGHVQEALHSPHANFVVRKCVERVPSTGVQFVIDELLEYGPSGIVEAARHRYGCRVIESLLASCPPQMLPPVVAPLLGDTVSLCGHMYGNFVMQKILEHGTEEQKRVVLDVLRRDILQLGPNFYGSAVYGSAFKTAPIEDRVHFAQMLAQNVSILAAMSRFKHGPEVVELCLGHIDEMSRQNIRAQLAVAAAQRQQAAASASSSTTPAPKAARVINKGRGSVNQARSGKSSKTFKG